MLTTLTLPLSVALLYPILTANIAYECAVVENAHTQFIQGKLEESDIPKHYPLAYKHCKQLGYTGSLSND